MLVYVRVRVCDGVAHVFSFQVELCRLFTLKNERLKCRFMCNVFCVLLYYKEQEEAEERKRRRTRRRRSRWRIGRSRRRRKRRGRRRRRWRSRKEKKKDN